jgi:hypothetical protein
VLYNIDFSRLYTFDVLMFFGMLAVFMLSRYFLRSDIEKKEHGTTDMKAYVKQEVFIYVTLFLLSAVYVTTLFFDIDILAKTLRFGVALLLLYIIALVLIRQVLLIYGREVEVSGQKYFKRGYEVSLFSLLIYIITFFIGVFLCIKIFELDTLIEIGGLWA